MNEPSVLLQIDPQWDQQVDAGRLVEAVLQTLRHVGLEEGVELTVVLLGDEEIVQMNRQYRDSDQPTDVLSFPYEPGGPDTEMAGYLGDVVIGYEQAARQASEEGHPVQEELLLLAVHGTLHLVGYDDEAPDTKEVMWAAQRAVMEQLGLAHVAPRW